MGILYLMDYLLLVILEYIFSHLFLIPICVYVLKTSPSSAKNNNCEKNEHEFNYIQNY
jgi:hypothetical protein